MSANDTSSGGLGGIGSGIGNFAQQFANQVNIAVTAIDKAAVDITGVIVATLIIIGVIAYFGHLDRRLGKGLLVGGVILFVLAKYLFPALGPGL